MPTAPAISVFLPVYNGAAHLAEALDSVTTQTFGDLELVVVDDGSTDGSWEILCAHAERDRRLRPHRLAANAGHRVASNEAIDRCRAPLLARLDQDDLCEPTRVERLVRAFAERPEVGLVHSWYRRWLPDGRRITRHPPATDTELRVRQLFDNAVCHTALAFRRRAVDALGEGYREVAGPQDYDLIVRLLGVTRSWCIPEPLAVYRQSTMAMSNQYADRMQAAVDEISRRQLEQLLPPHQIEGAQRAFRLRAGPGDAGGVAAVHRALTRLGELDPRVDLVELRRVRRRWTARALRAAMAPGAPAMARDPRLVAALVRHDPVGSLRALRAD